MDKTELLEILAKKLSDRVSNLERLIVETRASNNETKSSMGDKYETSREMIQQEINRLQMQLNEAITQRETLTKIPLKLSVIAETGALVETTGGLFFISTSAGELQVEDKRIFTVSPVSPFAKSIIGKNAGDVFLLNGSAQQIINIW